MNRRTFFQATIGSLIASQLPAPQPVYSWKDLSVTIPWEEMATDFIFQPCPVYQFLGKKVDRACANLERMGI